MSASPPERTALFVTARSRSSRLPRKMLTDIEGRPALWYVLRRMAAPVRPDLRVVCTTTSPEDDELHDFVLREGWKCFRGDEEDVLVRYRDAARAHGVGFFVNVDGDDLLCSTAHVDSILERRAATGADFVNCAELPFGGAPIGVACAALEDVCRRKGESETEGWGAYFTNGGFRVETVPAGPALARPAYRMTLDYPEDLEFFRAVIARLRAAGSTAFGLDEVVALLDREPALPAINQGVTEQYWERFNRKHGRRTLR